MGLPVEVNNLMMGAVGGYTVGRSLRFRLSANAYLNRTPASAGNRKTWTWSGWVKIGTSTSAMGVMSAGTDGNNWTGFRFNTDSTFAFYRVGPGGGTTTYLQTNQVFRDPSAWYHIVLQWDTTQATSTNRVKLYVNGSQVTAFSTTSYPVQNYDEAFFNTAVAHLFGNITSNTQYLDGYLAEVNFIDGQALTPSSFGAYDTNGVWQPKKYTGTYGTNGFYLPFSATSGWSVNSTTVGYLSVADNTQLNVTGPFTVEYWFYQPSSSNMCAFDRGGGTSTWSTTNGHQYLSFIQAGVLYWQWNTGGSTSSLSTTAPAAGQWHHVAIGYNGTTTRMWLNGASVGTSTNGYTIPTTTNLTRIGYLVSNDFNCTSSISNLRLVKSDVYGVGNTSITVPTSALTAIANTALLTANSSSAVDLSPNNLTITIAGDAKLTGFAPSAVGFGINSDQSGNGNHWNPNNINLSTSGTTADSMIDSPTNYADGGNGRGNYAVLNPIGKSGGTITDGNLQWASSGADGAQATASIALLPNTGKFYCEVLVGSKSSTYWSIGLFESRPVVWSGTAVNWRNDGYGGFTSYTQGDIIGMTVDTSTGSYQFYKNNSPTSAPSGTVTLTGQPIYFGAAQDSSGATANYTFNFGQRPFTYTPPSGYKALNTYNLPAPSIANGAQYMAATTYTGNGTSISVVNSGAFQPDLVWLKDRSAAYQHHWYDSVRGVQKVIYSSLTNAETTSSTLLTAFNSNGFTFANDAGGNTNGDSYIAWQWKGGGTGVTNNSGSITSTVSASPSSGFSIATYTAQSSGTATIGHGLGVAPSMVILKSRASAYDWAVYHSSIGNTAALRLNLTNASNTDVNWWNNTSPTSSVFTVGANYAAAGNTVAYCFSAVAGFSAFGKYTGNGSADGTFIYLGFRPRFFMVKRTDTAESWWIIDTARLGYNVSNPELYPNLTNTEGGNATSDILSNGIKLRNTWTGANTSGATYIYAAFAENPFSIARAR